MEPLLTADPAVAMKATRPSARFSVGRCDRCGAPELHRSRPRTTLERLVRALTPFTPMRCPACGRRRLRHQSQAEPRLVPVPSPSPAEVERAPGSTRRRRRRRGRHGIKQRTIRVLLTTLMGMVAAMWVGYWASKG